MDDIHQQGRNFKIARTSPGFLGRMVSIMKTNATLSANRNLSVEPHLDDSHGLRRNSDVSRISISGHRKTASEFSNTSPNGKSCGMPVKMLIAQEMSDEVDSRGSQPNLVAKLMGLDALPMVELDSPARVTCSRSHRSSVSCGDEQTIFAGPVDPNACKDVYETWQQPCSGKYEETENDKRMALVREKFSEAKRLSMDGRLHQSKQFQDALEVLSSNKDLFIKCLQEPHSIFSEHLNGWLSIPPPPDARRITVLLPSKVPENFTGAAVKDGKQVKKDPIYNRNHFETVRPGSSCSAGFKFCENSTQPTRIVVLKPSPGKLNGAKVIGSPDFEASKELCGKVLFGGADDGQSQGCREDAKPERHLQSNLGGLNRDDNSIPSVSCNGHISNDSSFLPDDNPRGSEVMSPMSRHSWDCLNTLGSPYSSLSYSHTFYSPDTSVFREAKKRLFERWAATASDSTCHEPSNDGKSSKSLGEMLALSEEKRPAAAAPGEGCSCSEELTGSSKAQSDHQIKMREYVDESPRDLVRSKSVPLGTRLDLGMPGPGDEDANSKAAKLSFKGMVSSLFSMRNKRSSLVKSLAAESKGDASSSVPEEIHDAAESRICKPPDNKALSSSEASSSSALIGNMAPEFVAKPAIFGRCGVNHQDQPSPVSVLDPHFGDECIARGVPQFIKSNHRGAKLTPNFRGSSAIGKSPAIGTIPRTLCWDELYAETESPHHHPVGECPATRRRSDEEAEWAVFAKTLLSVSGIQDEGLSNLCGERWYSHESPLDPSLRDSYMDVKGKRSRSTRKLVYDCTNAALVQIAGSSSGFCSGADASLGDKVWGVLKSLFSEEGERRISDKGEEENNMMNVDSVVREEVACWRWSDELRMEMKFVKKDVAGAVLDDLMYEAVNEFGQSLGQGSSD